MLHISKLAKYNAGYVFMFLVWAHYYYFFQFKKMKYEESYS